MNENITCTISKKKKTTKEKKYSFVTITRVERFERELPQNVVGGEKYRRAICFNIIYT